MRKKIVALVLAACMLVSGCGNSKDASSTDIESVELESNQKIVIGKITEIAGNEITYTVAEEVDTSSDSTDTDSKSGDSTEDDSKSSDNIAADSQGSESTDASSQKSGSTGANSQGSSSTESDSTSNSQQDSNMGTPPYMSQGGTPPDMNAGSPPDAQSGSSSSSNTNAEKSSGTSSNAKSNDNAKSDSNRGANKSNKTMYTLTDETATMTIPVGTSVVTSLGNETTFSRLSNGDVVKMIIETDSDGNKVIVGIWMV